MSDTPEGKSKTTFGKFILSKDERLIIKDPDVFKRDTPPPQLVERNDTKNFYRELSIFINYRKPNNIIIKGFPGSGKTVTVHLALSEIERNKALANDIKTFYVNCYGKNSIDVTRVLLINPAEKTFTTAMQKFLESIDRDTIIVLDEIDRSESNINELLYYLSRPKEMKCDFQHNIQVILISNNFDWEDNVPDNIRSSLQLRSIVFNPYDAGIIKDILKQRIKIGFMNENVVSDSLLQKISTFVEVNRNGDCRLALDIMFYSGLEAEKDNSEKILEKHVDKATKSAIYNLDKYQVSKLGDDHLLVALAVIIKKSRSLDDLYNNYVELLDSNDLSKSVPKKSKTMVYHILNHLHSLGVIEKNIEIDGNRAVPTRTLTLKGRIAGSIIFEELIVRGLRLKITLEE